MNPSLRVLKISLFLTGVFLLFWWPLSHWFYPVWYHAVLGFENPGRYVDEVLVKVIGLTGFFPTLLFFFAATDPLRNRDIIKVLIVNGLLGGLFTLYLIESGQFPQMEYLNVLLYFVTAWGLIRFYPWAQTKKRPDDLSTV